MRRALLVAIACATTLAAPPARGVDPDINAGAVFLVAAARISGPFTRAVILAAPNPAGGHVGVILNRPMKVSMAELFPEDSASRNVRAPVHFGGTYRMGAIVALLKADEPPGARSIEMMKGVWLVLHEPEIDQVLAKTPNDARYYAGLLAWADGSLERVIDAGVASLAPADASKLFLSDTSKLWEELKPAWPSARRYEVLREVERELRVDVPRIRAAFEDLR